MTYIPGTGEADIRKAREALQNPHPGDDRFDPDFMVLARCDKCGKHAYGPRKFMAEAMREHQESVCPARHTRPDEPQMMRLMYPKQ